MQIYLNGKLVPQEEARVSVFDHGFLYGDGVFEGIRVYDGNLFRMKEHIDRLYESAKSIALKIPLTPDEMTRSTAATVAANAKRDAYIRLVVSRGPGDLGIDPAKCARPTVVIIVTSITLYPAELYEKGIALATTSVRRVPMQCLDPRIKSLNYLNNVLAIIDAKKAGAIEGVMLNVQGRVAECTADNIFIVKHGRLKTPPELEGALGGITRAAVLDIARNAEIPCSETRMGLHDLYNADECFLTGTGAEVMPVTAVDGRQIGDGKPGKTTQRLLAALRDLRVKDGLRVDYDAPVQLPRIA
ncbi:MAG TPA: branched-chain-amino-acid transaminase [Candidatus Polarisedimenticolia bacterium]|nr:branched-chain-amino-acid transaminase [Candidatus Polarisedimenticolia bacterium]